MLASRKPILIVVLIGLALRVAAAVWLPDQSAQWDDARAYRLIGHAFWTTGSFTSFLYMPLYPLVAGISEARWPSLLIDIGLSTALIWLTYELTLAVFTDAAAALLAALIVAVYPQFIVFAILGLTEPLFMALFVAAYLCWYRGQFVAAAVVATLSILTRPAIDLLAPILVVYFALAIHRMPVTGAGRQLAVYALVYCALMAPWWLHNYNSYGAFVRLNLAGGENFYAGNNPMNKTGGGIREVDFSTKAFDGKYPNPVDRDSALFHAALDYVKQEPGAFLQRAWIKFLRFWRLWPYFDQYAKPAYIAMYIVTYVPIFILTLVYLALWGIREFWRIAPLLAFGGYLTLVNVVLVTSLRYRLPLEPFMMMFAAVAVARLARRWPAANALLARLA
jgi:4-amino-4-deoxy-L-arabinose transferase-like glycosyltransferase